MTFDDTFWDPINAAFSGTASPVKTEKGNERMTTEEELLYNEIRRPAGEMKLVSPTKKHQDFINYASHGQIMNSQRSR